MKSENINLVLYRNKSYKFQAIIFEEKSPKGEIEQKELYGK